MFEFGEVAVKIESRDDLQHSGGHEHHETGDHVKSKCVSRIRFHHNGNAVVKQSDGEDNANAPTQPWIDVVEGIEQTTKQ